MSADKCFLCKKYRNSKSGVKFFTYCFPSNKEVYDKWLAVCNLSEHEEKSFRPRICFNCFGPDDFLPLKLDSKRPVLKKESVPIPITISTNTHTTVPITISTNTLTNVPIPIPIIKYNKRKSEEVCMK